MAVKLRFLGKESTPKNSPTLYATDGTSYVIQGWIVSDEAILSRLVVPADETVVEVPAALLDYLSLDGLPTEERKLVPPIVHVKDNGNYIIQGDRVTDAETLSQMDMPDYESCVHVAKAAVAALVGV